MSFNGWVLIFSCLLSVPFLSFSTVFFLSCSVACNGVSLFDNEIVILNLFQNLFCQNSYSLSSLTLLASQLWKERKQLNKKYFICTQGFHACHEETLKARSYEFRTLSSPYRKSVFCNDKLKLLWTVVESNSEQQLKWLQIFWLIDCKALTTFKPCNNIFSPPYILFFTKKV